MGANCCCTAGQLSILRIIRCQLIDHITNSALTLQLLKKTDISPASLYGTAGHMFLPYKKKAP